MVATSRGHVITICNLVCWVSTSKVNLEARVRLQVVLAPIAFSPEKACFPTQLCLHCSTSTHLASLAPGYSTHTLPICMAALSSACCMACQPPKKRLVMIRNCNFQLSSPLSLFDGSWPKVPSWNNVRSSLNLQTSFNNGNGDCWDCHC